MYCNIIFLLRLLITKLKIFIASLKNQITLLDDTVLAKITTYKTYHIDLLVNILYKQLSYMFAIYNRVRKTTDYRYNTLALFRGRSPRLLIL